MKKFKNHEDFVKWYKDQPDPLDNVVMLHGLDPESVVTFGCQSCFHDTRYPRECYEIKMRLKFLTEEEIMQGAINIFCQRHDKYKFHLTLKRKWKCSVGCDYNGMVSYTAEMDAYETRGLHICDLCEEFHLPNVFLKGDAEDSDDLWEEKLWEEKP